jgi:hypothetical protein
MIHGSVPLPSKALLFCRTPTLAKCGGEAQHLEKLGFGVSRDSRMFRVIARGKTSCIGVFLGSLESF